MKRVALFIATHVAILLTLGLLLQLLGAPSILDAEASAATDPPRCSAAPPTPEVSLSGWYCPSGPPGG